MTQPQNKVTDCNGKTREGTDKEFHNKIHKIYKHTVIRTGFGKSTIGTALIGFGAVTTAAPLYAQPGTIPDHTSLAGLFMILMGVIIYYAGDLYNISQQKKIEKLRTQRTKDLIDERIDAEKERLAEEVIARAEKQKKEIDSELVKYLVDIRDGICTDLESITDLDLEYCKSRINSKQLTDIQYPDTIPAGEIIQIGIDKIKGRDEEVTIQKLLDYIYILYHIGLISKTKRIECRLKLEEGETDPKNF